MLIHGFYCNVLNALKGGGDIYE